MATLLELKALMSDSDLQDRVETALLVEVQAILAGTPTADQQKYAAHVFSAPRTEGQKALMYVLAKHNALTVAQIQGATDTSIRSAVAEAVPVLVVAFNAGAI